MIIKPKISKTFGELKIDASLPYDQSCRQLFEVCDLGAWSGRDCFLIGGGPSLRDPFFVKFLDEYICTRKFLSIGINKAFVWNPTINYSMDYSFWKDIKQQKDWIDYKGLKVFLRRRKDTFDDSIYVVNEINEKKISLDLKAGIYPGNNSGFGGLMLAIALGCKRIWLLGYDLMTTKEHTHWHGGYRKNTTTPQTLK